MRKLPIIVPALLIGFVIGIIGFNTVKKSKKESEERIKVSWKDSAISGHFSTVYRKRYMMIEQGAFLVRTEVETDEVLYVLFETESFNGYATDSAFQIETSCNKKACKYIFDKRGLNVYRDCDQKFNIARISVGSYAASNSNFDKCFTSITILSDETIKEYNE